ncbi:M28 family peptidase [Mycolicibacterium sp. 018/SC-01/001]|uniref:M28 family peptidase n=1 Tax=Mycolicibacterium sp. 018/SC-01/001 TaxID=2592069 RepID=UPI001180E827|nr:M28 family peptidase [Mycolicibacterium sp. 018/SC-01/001]TRW80970.1 M28 family peptidase [Mycolicibacterium sp. 018/SC-01/001]
MTSVARFETESIYAHVEALVALGHRRTGTPAGHAAADYVAERLRDCHIPEVVIDEVDSTRWDASHTRLTVGAEDVDCFPVNHSCAHDGPVGPFGTGRAGLTRRLVDLHTIHDDADLHDAIVIFDVSFGSHDLLELLGGEISKEQIDTSRYADFYDALPDGKLIDPYNTTLAATAQRVANAGAAGFIAVLADYFDSNRYLNEDYDGLALPGVWVTNAQGRQIRTHLAHDVGVTATLELIGSRHAVNGRSVVATLPGQSPETILIHSHHDSVWDGAVEDASGTALVLALARHFAAQPLDQRPRTLMFATMDTHFTGYEAHQQFVDDYVTAHPYGREILVDVALEHVARAAHARGGELVEIGGPEPRVVLTNTGHTVVESIQRALEGLPRLAVLPTSALPGDEIPTDADYNYQAGVPIVSLVSAPIYLYDEADTLDKVDKSQLAPLASAFAHIIEDLGVIARELIPDTAPVAPSGLP